MSGGSSGGGDFTPSDGGSDCADLAFSASLSSPDEDAIAGLALGDVLDVELREESGRPVIGVLKDGTPVGSLTTRVAELLRCLREGNDFGATVVEIDDGNVRVDVASK